MGQPASRSYEDERGPGPSNSPPFRDGDGDVEDVGPGCCQGSRSEYAGQGEAPGCLGPSWAAGRAGATRPVAGGLGRGNSDWSRGSKATGEPPSPPPGRALGPGVG